MGLWNKPEVNLPSSSSHHQSQYLLRSSSTQNNHREEEQSDDVFHETLDLRTTTTDTKSNEKQSLFNRRDPNALPWSLRAAPSEEEDTANGEGELFTTTESIIDETYQRIMAFQNITLPHECFVAVIDGSLFLENTADNRMPVVWCDIILPTGLNITAEIKDGNCDTFNEPATSEYYTEGKASPIYLPTFTTEEKLQGTFDHAYCAGIDILYDVNQNGIVESVLNQRYAMEVTYAYDNVYGESGFNEIINSATLSDESTKSANRNESLAIGLGVLAGSVLTLALIALIYGEKRKRKWKRRDDIDINNENELAEIDAAAEEEGLEGGGKDDVKIELVSIT